MATSSDSGSGISVERQQELFQPFSRLGADDTDIEGTGIGLTISQRLIEMMGGKIGVESKKNCGSTFWIELPEDASTTATQSDGRAYAPTDGVRS